MIQIMQAQRDRNFTLNQREIHLFEFNFSYNPHLQPVDRLSLEFERVLAVSFHIICTKIYIFKINPGSWFDAQSLHNYLS